jgi:hypothetical protein
MDGWCEIFKPNDKFAILNKNALMNSALRLWSRYARMDIVRRPLTFQTAVN